MITIFKVTMDVPIEHHPDASDDYLEIAVKQSIFNQKISCVNRNPVSSYAVKECINWDVVKNEVPE